MFCNKFAPLTPEKNGSSVKSYSDNLEQTSEADHGIKLSHENIDLKNQTKTIPKVMKKSVFM